MDSDKSEITRTGANGVADLSRHYNHIWNSSLLKFEKGEFALDRQIDGSDLRRGMTLLIRPNRVIKKRIRQFQNELAKIEPHQYYYPASDIHVTLLSVISCYQGFSIEGQLNIDDYIELTRACIEPAKIFAIDFHGITASPSGVLLQGFATEGLNELRDKLRTEFKKSDLEQSIDIRYRIQTAHATVMRFAQPISDNQALIDVLLKYRDVEFGEIAVASMELTYNDWYLQDRYTKKLCTFELGR